MSGSHVFTIEARRVHFVGIGGIGMSGLAKILLEDGYEVSGSDLAFNRNTQQLEALGARISKGHDAGNAAGADLVVVTSAAPETNPEVRWARSNQVPVVKRAVFLGRLMGQKRGVAIAGTAGKTTTTAMLASILLGAGLDPTIACGGDLLEIDSNAALGRGPHFVAEADEFDRSFLELPAEVKVITNIEADHLDLYGTMDALLDAFREFASSGTIILNAEDPQTVALGHALSGDVRFFSSAGLASTVQLPVPGAHNRANAAAALAASDVLDIPRPAAVAALNRFRGTRRRLELIGEARGVRVIDDYAHHPTKIRASLSALRELKPGRLIVIFQPHLYARTKDLFDEFVHAFGDADEVIIVETYSPAGREEAREKTSQDLANAMGVTYIPTLEGAAEALDPPAGSIVVAMGAGTITNLPGLLLARLRR